jgi:hypothetical protein
MAKKTELKVGDRVEFLRSHDKHVKLKGVIVKIHEHSELVDIDRDVDGKIVEVKGVETAHAADVKVLERPKAKAKGEAKP